MKLTNKIKVLGPYKGKTKMAIFNEMQVGDIIELSLEIASPGNNRGSLYATYICFTNHGAPGWHGEKVMQASLTNATNYLRKFEWEEFTEK